MIQQQMKHGSPYSRLTHNTRNSGSQTPPSKIEVAKQEKNWVLAGGISTRVGVQPNPYLQSKLLKKIKA
jgi:hypothetical protein